MKRLGSDLQALSFTSDLTTLQPPLSLPPTLSVVVYHLLLCTSDSHTHTGQPKANVLRLQTFCEMYPGGHSTSWAGGPSKHAKSYASRLQEHDSLFHSYEHLTGVPQPDEALRRLRRIASLVKPIMRKRGWQIQVLTEFMPDDARLLGMENLHKLREHLTNACKD